MPTPVGHAIAGMACGWLVAGTPRDRSRAVREAFVFGGLGALADIDLLFGTHSGPTHSIGAAAIIAVSALILLSAAGKRPGALALPPTLLLAFACSTAYGSHVLLDWLATDSTPPIGVMALWPFSRQHYESDLHVFMAISRRYHQGWTFVRQNTIALARELVILTPALILVVLIRRRG
jgi:membrane-bound metal-dependent hydrolase YbcI (DUF457 family)